MLRKKTILNYIVIALITSFILSGCEHDSKKFKDIIDAIKVDREPSSVIVEDNNEYILENSELTSSGYIQENENIEREDAEDTKNENSTSESSEVKRETKSLLAEEKPSNWYIRLLAKETVGGMRTESTQLGQLEEQNAVSIHSLKAIPLLKGTYLDIVFINPSGVSSGKYKTNFHNYKGNSEDRWNFTVEIDASHIDSDITLRWRGIFVLNPYIDKQNRKRYKEYRSITNPLMQYMKLIDSATGEEIPAIIDGKIQKYNFNMDGSQSRTFELVLKSEKVNIKVKQKKIIVSKSKVIENNTQAQKSNKIEDKNKFFDLSQPPMIESKMNYKKVNN